MKKKLKEASGFTGKYELLGKNSQTNKWEYITKMGGENPLDAFENIKEWLRSKNMKQFVEFALRVPGGDIVGKFSDLNPGKPAQPANSLAERKKSNLEEVASFLFTDEEKVVKEENFPQQYPTKMADTAPVDYVPVSLDQILDRYLIRYEKESIPTSGDMDVAAAAQGMQPPTAPTFQESKKPKSNLDKLTSYLFEQAAPPAAEEEEEPAADDAAAADAPPADDAGGGDIPGLDLGGGGDDAAAGGGDAAAKEPVVNTPTIDLNDFARSVARLVNNFDALLNPQTVILNRVKAYIMSNYDERTAKELMQILDVNYGLRPVSTQYPEQHKNPVVYGTAGISGGG